MSEPIYEALDPRSDPADVTLVPLADRPISLDGTRVTFVQTMPPGSGLEDVITGLGAALHDAWPTTRHERFMRRNFMMTDVAEIDEVAAGCDVAVVVAGPAATMVHLALIFAQGLEERGVPAPVVHFAPLAPSAEHSLTTIGAPIRIFPIANPPRTDSVAAAACAPVVASLTTPLSAVERRSDVRRTPVRRRVAASGSLAEVTDEFHRRGWTDGLPIVPPTESALAEMLTGTSRPPDDVVTETFRPESRRVTVEMVAITAAMAGARPEFLPVILAAATVYGDLQFESMTRSVNSFAFGHLVSGPIAAEIGMDGGLGALGPGNRANATIGRAVSLLFRTVGGSRQGINATPTQGSAVGYSAAYTEHVADSPWEPFHVGLGYGADESTVSVLLGGWAHNGNFYYGGLDEIASALQAFEIPQTGAFVFLSSKRAHHLADEGFTRQSVSSYLQQRATIRLGDFRASGFWPMSRGQIEGRGPSTAPVWPSDYLTLPDDAIVPGYPPGTIHVVVAGSDVSSLAQVWKWQLHRTVVVDAWR